VHRALDTLLSCPAPQAAHDVPPAADSVSVTDPAPHTAHATVDALLYCPAAHATQLVAPILLRVFVIHPATHDLHLACATLS
jgi:hypothetical protein